jgi:hypothetical protein
MKLPLQIHQTITKFFRPLGKKYRLWTILISLIIGIAFYISVDIVTAEVVRQNSYPINMLAAEMLIERGPDYTKESGKYADLIEEYYTKHFEERDYAFILRTLCPSLSPQKALASTKEALEKAAEGNDEEAKQVIYQAGKAINQLYLLSEKFPRSPVKLFESEEVPDWLLTKLNNAFDAFHKQVGEIENAQNVNEATDRCRKGCRYSRRALLLLYLAGIGYDNEEQRIERFASDLQKAIDLARYFSEKYKSEQVLFCDRFENMKIRAQVVDALLDNDIDKTRELLREVIDRALKVFAKENANADA